MAESLSACLQGGGKMGALMRAHDWSGNPLGSPETWALSLQTMISSVLNSPLLGCVLWGPELRMLYNDAYVPALQERHPQALGQPLAEVWAEIWDTLSGPFLGVLNTGQGIAQDRFEIVMLRHGMREQTFWNYSVSPILDHGGRVVGVLNNALEVTAQVRAEQRQAEADKRLRALNESLEQQVQERTAELRLYTDIVQSDPSPILAFDIEHRVIGFNQAHFDQFARVMSHDQQLGDKLPDLFPPDQADLLRGLMDRALSGEAFAVVEEFGGDEAKPVWDISYTPLRSAGGAIVGAFHHARDISGRMRNQREMVKLQEQLTQSQKMEAVGQLTGGVAHDFNNLLTVIRSSVDLLKRPNLPEDRRSRYVSAISDTVDRAAKLTGQLLAFARRQALKPEVFDACDSVRALSDMMVTLTGSRITVASILPEERCFVLADPSQFDTALINMAVNARDAMEGKGRLTLEVRSVEELPSVRAHPAVTGSYVAVSLTDTGAGIAPDQIDRIFEPFFTTKEVGKGTGLGLSQVFGFAKQSGGDIAVSSALGEGTTFTLYLPRVAASEQVEEKIEPATLIDGHGTRVLVVEDNLDVGTFAVQMLSDLGYKPVLALDGEAALVELAKGADRFDVVFSDVVMPGMGGIELGREIRRLYHDLPVVLTSGYSHVLAQNGTYGFELLHKPYSVEQLSQILRKVATWKRRKRLIP